VLLLLLRRRRLLVATAPIHLALVPHVQLLVLQELLLGSENAARSRNPRPRYRFGRRELEMLHQVAANQRSRSPEPRLAVNCDGTGSLLADSEEPVG